jgi:hypothetical protein
LVDRRHRRIMAPDFGDWLALSAVAYLAASPAPIIQD